MGTVFAAAYPYKQSAEESPDEKISDLIAHIQDAGGPIAFSSSAVLNNAQRSGGVLKSEICLNLTRYLQLLHIETIDDFRNFESQELLEIVVHSVKGLGDAGTNYLFMLAGDPNRCKPDVHIHHCIRDACGADISNDECQILFIDTVTELRKDYPEITVAMLDGIIWRKYQTSKQK